MFSKLQTLIFKFIQMILTTEVFTNLNITLQDLFDFPFSINILISFLHCLPFSLEAFVIKKKDDIFAKLSKIKMFVSLKNSSKIIQRKSFIVQSFTKFY